MGRTDFQVENVMKSDLVFDFCLHTYYLTSGVQNISVSGFKGYKYLDKTDDKKEKADSEDGGATITREVDRVYFSHKPDGAHVISDKGFGAKLTVQKSGMEQTVLWNPWIAKSKT